VELERLRQPPFNFAQNDGKGERVKDMGVAWGQAFQIGGVGFGTVFVVLGILAGVLLLVGLAIRRVTRGKGEANSEKKGD